MEAGKGGQTGCTLLFTLCTVLNRVLQAGPGLIATTVVPGLSLTTTAAIPGINLELEPALQ